MAISARAVGSWVDSNATTQVVTLPTHAAGDMLIVRVAAKHATFPPTITCGTSGWTKLGQYDNGQGSSSNGGGGVAVAVFYKEAASSSETNPTITYHASVAATPSVAVAVSYQKGAEETWVTPVGDGGSDVDGGTSYSATIASHVSATAGDVIDVFTAISDNYAMTVPTFTQSGLTLATVVEYPDAAISTTLSNDMAADGCYRSVTSGTSSAALVATNTLATGEPGTTWQTRLRVSNPNATVTPSVVAAVAAVPAVTKQTGWTTSPSVLAATTAVPQAVVPVFVSVLAATTAVPTVTKQEGAGRSPTVLTAVVAAPAVTKQTSWTVSVSVLTSATAIPQPTTVVESSDSKSPTVLAAVAAVPTPTVSVGGVAPDLLVSSTLVMVIA